jgi:hypothetical protein
MTSPKGKVLASLEQLPVLTSDETSHSSNGHLPVGLEGEGAGVNRSQATIMVELALESRIEL